ncbi:MAG: hypothetical protein AAFP04_10145 [Myxococcota bacterium]
MRSVFASDGAFSLLYEFFYTEESLERVTVRNQDGDGGTFRVGLRVSG